MPIVLLFALGWALISCEDTSSSLNSSTAQSSSESLTQESSSLSNTQQPATYDGGYVWEYLDATSSAVETIAFNHLEVVGEQLAPFDSAAQTPVSNVQFRLDSQTGQFEFQALVQGKSLEISGTFFKEGAVLGEYVYESFQKQTGRIQGIRYTHGSTFRYTETHDLQLESDLLPTQRLSISWKQGLVDEEVFLNQTALRVVGRIFEDGVWVIYALGQPFLTLKGKLDGTCRTTGDFQFQSAQGTLEGDVPQSSCNTSTDQLSGSQASRSIESMFISEEEAQQIQADSLAFEEALSESFWKENGESLLPLFFGEESEDDDEDAAGEDAEEKETNEEPTVSQSSNMVSEFCQEMRPLIFDQRGFANLDVTKNFNKGSESDLELPLGKGHDIVLIHGLDPQVLFQWEDDTLPSCEQHTERFEQYWEDFARSNWDSWIEELLIGQRVLLIRWSGRDRLDTIVASVVSQLEQAREKGFCEDVCPIFSFSTGGPITTKLLKDSYDSSGTSNDYSWIWDRVPFTLNLAPAWNGALMSQIAVEVANGVSNSWIDQIVALLATGITEDTDVERLGVIQDLVPNQMLRLNGVDESHTPNFSVSGKYFVIPDSLVIPGPDDATLSPDSTCGSRVVAEYDSCSPDVDYDGEYDEGGFSAPSSFYKNAFPILMGEEEHVSGMMHLKNASGADLLLIHHVPDVEFSPLGDRTLVEKKSSSLFFESRTLEGSETRPMGYYATQLLLGD